MPLKIETRWLIGRDIPEVLEIERKSFKRAWTKEELHCCLRKTTNIGMVAECNHRVIGFMVYELHKSKLHVLNIAVDPDFRRQGVGSQMIEKLVDKLSEQRRDEIILAVRESNLAGQLFFRSRGFLATSVMQGYFDEDGEDDKDGENAIAMRYSLADQLDWHQIADGQSNIAEVSNGVVFDVESHAL